MPDDIEFEAMKMEYTTLRAEILQSISYQHQILLGGYGASGAFVSYVAIKSASPNYLPALIITPYILLGMASLWIVECNRMVRASHYIGQILWPSLREKSESECPRWRYVDWECWIRSKSNRRAASHFRKRQHRYQCVVIFWGPVFLSTLASIFAILDAFNNGLPTNILEGMLPWTLCLLALLAAIFWRRIYSDLSAISDLGNSPVRGARQDDRDLASGGEDNAEGY